MPTHPPSLTSLARRRRLPSTRLSRLRGLAVIAHCGDPDCPAPRAIPMGDVLAARGDVPLAEVLGGFRCTACGRGAQAVSLRQDCPGGWIVQPVASPGRREVA